MAIQNFVSGGFYGKLGQVVGQRWRNKRTLRTYVIPADPKTPAQMAERKRFGGAVPFAQYARLSNTCCTFFNTQDFTEWNYRMRTANQLYTRETEFLKRLPLIPYGYSAPYVPTSCSFSYSSSTKRAYFTIQGLMPEVKRSISIYATKEVNTENPDDVLLLYAESTDETPGFFTSNQFENFVLDEDTFVRIVSNDDKDSQTDMILSNPIQLQSSGKLVLPFNTTITKVEVADETTTIDFAQAWADEDNDVQILSSSVVKNFAFVSGDFSSATLSNNGGNVRLTLVQSDYAENGGYAWTDNSQLVLSEIRVEDADTIFKAENVTLNPKETVERNRFNTIGSGTVKPNSNTTDFSLTVPNSFIAVGLSGEKSEAVYFGETFTNVSLQKNTLSQVGTQVETNFTVKLPDVDAEGLIYFAIPKVSAGNSTPIGVIGTFDGFTFIGIAANNTVDISAGKWQETLSPTLENVRDDYALHIKSNIKKTASLLAFTMTKDMGVNEWSLRLTPTTKSVSVGTIAEVDTSVGFVVAQPTKKLSATWNCSTDISTDLLDDTYTKITMSASAVANKNNWNRYYLPTAEIGTKIQAVLPLSIQSISPRPLSANYANGYIEFGLLYASGNSYLTKIESTVSAQATLSLVTTDAGTITVGGNVAQGEFTKRNLAQRAPMANTVVNGGVVADGALIAHYNSGTNGTPNGITLTSSDGIGFLKATINGEEYHIGIGDGNSQGAITLSPSESSVIISNSTTIKYTV